MNDCRLKFNRFRRANHRRGATLIDVAIGSMLLSLLLIPVVKMMGQSQTLTARLNDRDAMLFEAEQLVETLKLNLSESSQFDLAHSRGIDQVSRVATSSGKTFITRSQAYADTTLTSSPLISIDVTVWIDANRNGAVDAVETSEMLRTQMARP